MSIVLQILLSDDVSRAVDLITRDDTTQTAMPNRVLYDLVAEFDAVSGNRFRLMTDFGGSLENAASSLAATMDSRSMLDGGHGAALAPLFDIVNRRLRAGGHVDFKPTTPDWPAP